MESGFDIKENEELTDAKHIKPEIKQALLWFVSVVVITAAAVWTFFHTILGLGRVLESSMIPALHEGDFVVYNRLFASYQPGDVIVFTELNTGKLYIKRVIAKGGDVVNIPEEGGVYVNGRLLGEPYLYEGVKTLAKGDVVFPIVVPEGYVFVLGDNREVSVDSRWKKVGMIKESSISGKLIYSGN